MFLLDQKISMNATLICPSVEPAIARPAIITRFADDRCDLEVDTRGLTPGLGAVVEVEERTGLKLMGMVEVVGDGVVELSIHRQVRLDRRHFPREYAGIRARYQRIPGTELKALTKQFLSGLTLVSDRTWHEPKPYMNFSPSGLRFIDAAHVGAGDFVLLELTLPDMQKTVRTAAQVVRVEATDGDHYEIAIAFVTPPPDTVEALTELTLDRQIAAISAELE